MTNNKKMELKFKKYGRKKDKFAPKHGVVKHCIYEDESGSMKLELYCPEDNVRKRIKISIENDKA